MLHQGRDPSNSQPIRYGEFFAENQGAIKVSKTNHTSFRMVDSNSTPQSNGPRDHGVFLEALIPGSSDRLCCTYDANPSSSMPMRLNNCQGLDNGGDGHSSQTFSYDAVTGRIGLIWSGLTNQTTAQTSNSTVARRDDAHTSSIGGVGLIWLPSQNATARVGATSSGVQTQTVTVTVIAEMETGSVSTTSAARGASETSSSLSGTSSPTQVSASSDMVTQTQTPTTQSTGEAPSSTASELKIEVAPPDASSTGPATPSSASALADATPSDPSIATGSGASWGVPVRDGEVIDPILQSRHM